MAAGDTTQGRRIPDGKWWDDDIHPAPWQPSDYGRERQAGHVSGNELVGPLDGTWVVLPNGVGPSFLPARMWAITEHEDGTLSLSPSILNSGGWHGFLERGWWREC